MFCIFGFDLGHRRGYMVEDLRVKRLRIVARCRRLGGFGILRLCQNTHPQCGGQAMFGVHDNGNHKD